MSKADVAAVMLAPYGSGERAEQRLAGTGTTEATNATALTRGHMATLMVSSAVGVRINFGSATAPGCAVTDLTIAAGQRFDWTVEPDTAFVSIEAEDGSSAYEAWVWTSSPGQ
jgi:hypothetical protein